MTRFMAAVVMVMGCGPARLPGDQCNPDAGRICFDHATEGICDNGAWIERRCDGTATQGNGMVVGRCGERRCIAPVPAIGDWCPVSFEGQPSRCLSTEAVAVCLGQAWTSCPTPLVNSRPGCEEFFLGGEVENGFALSYGLAPDAGCR